MPRKTMTKTSTKTSTKVALAVAASGIILAAGFASLGSIRQQQLQIHRSSGSLPFQTSGYTPGYVPGHIPGYTPGYGVPGYVPGYGTFRPLTPRQMQRIKNRAIRVKMPRIIRPWRSFNRP